MSEIIFIIIAVVISVIITIPIIIAKNYNENKVIDRMLNRVPKDVVINNVEDLFE